MPHDFTSHHLQQLKGQPFPTAKARPLTTGSSIAPAYTTPHQVMHNYQLIDVVLPPDFILSIARDEGGGVAYSIQSYGEGEVSEEWLAALAGEHLFGSLLCRGAN